MEKIKPAKKRILIMAGGTGGHVFPALVVAKAMRREGWQVDWLGTAQGLETQLVPRENFPLHFIPVTAFRREGLMKRLLAPFRLTRALFQSFNIIRRLNPDVVLGMGGFAAGPGGIAAWLLRKPIVIHEQNAIAGVTNSVLAHLATCVLEAFPGSFERKAWYRGKNIISTGNPVREELFKIPPPKVRFEQSSTILKILIVGGSQGAKALNELCPETFSRIPVELRPHIKHQVGAGNKEKVESLYQSVKVLAEVEPFYHNMDAVYQWADIVICRAGALTISELAAVGIGSILIPFPFAVDDHQTYNARYLEQAGAAELISQTVLNPDKLADIIINLSRNRAKVIHMAEAAKTKAMPNALQNVIKFCVEASQKQDEKILNEKT